jgi:pilus assembly protein Flp/PilA
MPAISRLYQQIWRRLLKDSRGQDLIEYALMAGSLSLSCGVLLPPVIPAISTVVSRIGSVLDAIP